MPSKIDWSSLRGTDPKELFLFSLRTGKKLPDELHNAMILWSFDDKHVEVVKDYFEWAEHCVRRDEAMEQTRKKIESTLKIDETLNLVCFLVILLFFASVFISGNLR
jgi:hypothetical protein